MSRSTAAVRFPDGTVRYTLFNGTSGTLWTMLFDTSDEAWDVLLTAYRENRFSDMYAEPEGPIEEVVIYSDYGDGWYWPGTSARNAVVGPRSCEQWNGTETDGRPDWWLSRKALD